MARKDEECKICNIAAGLSVATSICHQIKKYASDLDCEKLKEEVIQGRLEFSDFIKMLKEKARLEERELVEEVERLVEESV